MRALSALLAIALTALPGAAAADAPQWGPSVVVAHVPLDGAWFVSNVAVTDLNGDGHEDALVTRSSFDAQHTYPVTILLGDGTGKFTDATASIFTGNVPQVQFPRQIVTADFNGDHRADVFIADTGDDHDPWPGFQNTLILSAPDGRLVDATANLPQVSDMSHSAAAADVNGDGSPDIYVGNVYGANQIGPRILLNDGSGHFTLGVGLLPAVQSDLSKAKYSGSAFSDVNGDGKPDLVLSADDFTAESALLLNDGSGHFSVLSGALPAKPFGTNAIGLNPTPIELSGDAHPDLVIGYTKGDPFYVGRWIQVLIGNGDGTFHDETATRLPQGDNGDAWPQWFYPRDLDHDGHADLGVVTSGPQAAPLVLLFGSDGIFRPGPVIDLNQQAWSFIDAKGDGSNDVLGAAGSGDVRLLPELRGAQPPVEPPPAQPPAVDKRAPILTPPLFTPGSFRAARSGLSIARARVGASVYYRNSEQATTTFTVARCAKRPHRSRHRRRCARSVRVAGSFSHSDASGPNRFRFSGRIGGRSLAPGNYRLRATPRDAAGNVGATVAAPFRIVR